jgi:hypothetical protein
MSLDVYLRFPGARVIRKGIYIRRDGRTVEISRAEWDELFPGRAPVTATTYNDYIYQSNITHNLSRMANEAGLHEVLWRPGEHGLKHARDLVEPLREGLAALQTEPDRFKAFNPENGWGDYEGLVDFVADYLGACLAWPDAEVDVWR